MPHQTAWRAEVCVDASATIRDAIARIDRNQRGIVLVVDERGALLDTVTDGDIRRALLAGQDLNAPIAELMRHKMARRSTAPVTASLGAERAELLALMKDHAVRQIPLVTPDGVVAALMTLDELLPNDRPRLQAVIVAGGSGTRLRPLTDEMPKPMLRVGDRPLMELTVERLREAGIRKVHVTTCYQHEKIQEHFGDGRGFGVEFTYMNESVPLGTAGGLAQLEETDEPLLIINGDVLTGLHIGAMLDYHREHEADLTVAVRKYDLAVPYGVVEGDAPEVRRIVEKPTYSFFVNAGIYILQPTMRRHVPRDQSFHMTDLIHRLVEIGQRVVSFPVLEYWLDIGEPLQYEQAQLDVKQGRLVR
jgi:dTDP-glucose pyrophosphorylase/CBS domain-containing protein